jgi:hypothetical protein
MLIMKFILIASNRRGLLANCKQPVEHLAPRRLAANTLAAMTMQSNALGYVTAIVQAVLTKYGNIHERGLHSFVTSGQNTDRVQKEKREVA